MGYQTIDDLNEVRRRRLDELFADVPYLSPTMKASRLHERFAVSGAPAVAAVRREDVAELGDEGWLAEMNDLPEPPPQPRLQPTPATPQTAPAADAREVVRVEILLDASSNPPRVQGVQSVGQGPDVLRLREAAAYLRVGVRRVREWVRSGALPCARIGRQYRFRRSALAEFLASME